MDTHTHTKHTSKSLAVMNISSKASRFKGSFGRPAEGSEFSVEGSVVPPSTPELVVEAPPTTNEGAGPKPPEDKSLQNIKQCVCLRECVCVCVRRTYSQHRERPP